MRLLVLITDGFGGHGGIAKFNRDFLQALCAHTGVEQVVALPRLMPEPPGPMPEKLRYELAGLGGKGRFARAVLQTTRRERPWDLVICGHLNLAPLAWGAARLAGTPFVLIVHGTEAWQPPAGRLVRAAVRRAHGYVAVSRLTSRRFGRWSGLDPERAWILPNCVDLERFQPGPRNPELVKRYGLQEARVLLTVGRLDARERYKGVDEVLEALPHLRQHVRNLHYLIVGDGSDRPRLEQKAEQLGLKSCVHFAGRIPENEKVDHYRLADAFVMPGRGEGFGIVYLEAMACGIPVVASRADASIEAVRDGALGVAVNPANPEEVRAGILEALNRPRGVRPQGLEYFSFDSFVRRAGAWLDAVSTGSHPARALARDRACESFQSSA